MLEDKLEIIIVTYNRHKYLKETLSKVFDEQSPIKDLSVTIIDNNSTDDTQKLCIEYANNYYNCHYSKNPYNVGWTNIAKAFETAKKPYIWVLADDDTFDFTHWEEVEQAINENEDIICTCHHILDSQYKKNNILYQTIELSLLSAGIYKTANFNDTLMKNMYDNIYTMFPHMTISISALNNPNMKVKVLEHELLILGINLNKTDYSYIRGLDKNNVWPRNYAMNWISGFANIYSGIKDRKLQIDLMNCAIAQPWLYKTNFKCAKSIVKMYLQSKYWNQIMDIFIVVDFKTKLLIILSFIYQQILNIIKTILHIKKRQI